MKLESISIRLGAGLALFVLAAGSFAVAEDGKLAVHATPKQAFVFVDGQALGQAKHTYTLPAGDHQLEVTNYGYQPTKQSITITAGQTTRVSVDLSKVTDTVSGPWGAMTIEGADHYAVLLNGKTPDFYVGHGDEFDHDWWWKQELVVPPGNYQVTVLNKDKEVWSSPVDVPADQRVVIDVPNGIRKTIPWSRGQKLASTPRFTVGSASATVAVAKPTAQLAAGASQINCGDSSQLKWSSTDAPAVALTPVGNVAPSGEQNVQPTQTTTYELKATGPGGTATTNTTVNVNNAIQANLAVSPAEIRYKKIGDAVVEQGNPSINWTAANANNVSIDPIGAVNVNGTQTLPGVPKKTDTGAVDETVTYTLNATNACGGTTTQTATLHIVGSIEDAATLGINSIYFPTDVPRSVASKNALVASQQATLTAIADSFKTYVQHKPDARLILTGYADERGADDYNKDLSQRRAEVAKNFLVQQGVTEDHVEIQAYGKEQNLSPDEVKQLIEQDPDLSDADRQAALDKMHTVVLANNRRVDISLNSGQQSLRRYPYKAEDYSVLVDRNGEKNGGVELASEKKKLDN